jgi:succinylglutamate desuccinylase
MSLEVVESGGALRRELGRVRGDEVGPTLVVIAGIHGNEPAGIAAVERVIGKIGEIRGEVIALAGNLGALRARRRYVSKDLNRLWTEERVARVRAGGTAEAEDHEQEELLDHVEGAIARARGDVYVVDLHTTSAAGHPFVLFGDTRRQRAFARAFPIPIILGLEEQVDGVVSQYLTRRGCVTVAIEGGQHDDPTSVDHLEAAIWIAIATAGLARPAEAEKSALLLERRRGALPRVMEVLERHAIEPSDEFAMAPGFANLDRARIGQLLARDKRGEIRAPSDGMVILPLYQGQGADGFFWGREVSERRLGAEDAIRRMGLDRILPYLPGVRRDRDRPDRLVCDTRIARLYPLDVFHVFGYRRIRRDGPRLIVERQPD